MVRTPFYVSQCTLWSLYLHLFLNSRDYTTLHVKDEHGPLVSGDILILDFCQYLPVLSFLSFLRQFLAISTTECIYVRQTVKMTLFALSYLNLAAT